MFDDCFLSRLTFCFFLTIILGNNSMYFMTSDVSLWSHSAIGYYSFSTSLSALKYKDDCEELITDNRVFCYNHFVP